MTTTDRPSVTPSRAPTADAYAEPSPWLVFSGIMLMVAGIMRFFDSIWAFAYKGALPENLQNAVFGDSLRTYAWTWLAVAVVLFLCGIGVMVHNQLARWVGVAAGAITTISAVWWMPYYPVWSLVYAGIGIVVIYALVTRARPVG